MKLHSLCLLLFITIACLACTGEAKKSGDSDTAKEVLLRFPGFNKQQIEQLLLAKEQYCISSALDSIERSALEKATKGKCSIALPTWVPSGFTVESMKLKLGMEIHPDSLAVSILYTRKTANGKKQAFIIEAGFEFGDLPYGDPFIVNAPVGKINLYYEPVDDSISADKDSWGKKTKDYVITDWFKCDTTGYPKYMYMSIEQSLVHEHIVDEGAFEMISLEETKKIIGSIEKF